MTEAKSQMTRIAAYGLVLDRAHILLCRLAEHVPESGMWTLPGGGINFGEHPEAGMIREVQEETGLIVQTVSITGIVPTKCELSIGKVPTRSIGNSPTY